MKHTDGIMREYGLIVGLVILEFALAAAMRFVPRTAFYADVIGKSYSSFSGYLIALFPTIGAAAAFGFLLYFLIVKGQRSAHNVAPALIFFLFSLWTAVFLWLNLGDSTVSFDADAVVIAVMIPSSAYTVERIIFDPQFVGILVGFIILFTSLFLRQAKR